MSSLPSCLILSLSLISLSEASAPLADFSQVTMSAVHAGKCNALDYRLDRSTKLSCATGTGELFGRLEDLKDIRMAEKVAECGSAEEVCATVMQIREVSLRLGAWSKVQHWVSLCLLAMP